MLVFTDFHHASLLNSTIMLFEGRLGASVFRPIGTQWFEQGFWALYNHPATVQQYLGINGATPDGTPALNDIVGRIGRVWLCHDIDSNFANKAIEFDTFMQMPFDIVIASIPQHIEPFARLCAMHPNHPKLIYQIGNQWNLEANAPVRNILASAKIDNVPAGFNFVSYHQEFDTKVFRVTAPYDTKNIFSFANCFNLDQLFAKDWQLFTKVEAAMPTWQFKAFGGQCRDGAAHGSQELADSIALSRFVWHTKAGGDGYGHIIHNSAAMARPLIVVRQYYAGKLGEALMQDGKTCIAIDDLGVDEIVNKINYYNQPANYCQMVQNVADNFREVVNFDLEAIRIKAFLDNLI